MSKKKPKKEVVPKDERPVMSDPMEIRKFVNTLAGKSLAVIQDEVVKYHNSQHMALQGRVVLAIFGAVFPLMLKSAHDVQVKREMQANS